jgi:predicted Zn-dependent protease
MKKNLKLILISIFLFGCSQQFSQMGSSILSSTGIVTGSQADAIFAAGNKLSKSVEKVTDEQEYYLGRAVSASILSKYPLYQNASVTNYANKIAGVLVSHSTRPETFGGYYVAFLDTPQINAVSAPGGYIFISKGFLSLLDNEDQLAAVIAHEIAHVALKHGTQAISDSNLTDALQIIGKEAVNTAASGSFSELNSLFGDSVNEVVGTLLDKGYSRSQEYDSDEYAANLLNKAGYNSAELSVALGKLSKAGTDKGGWFDTHPDSADRIDELEDFNNSSNVTSGQAKREQRFKKILKVK